MGDAAYLPADLLAPCGLFSLLVYTTQNTLLMVAQSGLSQIVLIKKCPIDLLTGLSHEGSVKIQSPSSQKTIACVDKTKQKQTKRKRSIC